MLVVWLVLPLALVALCLGWGTLASVAVGRGLPAELTVPLGFATVVVGASLVVWVPGLAPLATPVAAGGGLAGLGVVAARRPPAPSLWAVAAAAATFLAYAAPTLLAGEPTFAGYVSLDDSATWFALTDHVLEHGRDVGGLAPSSFEATVDAYLSGGYPYGSLLPLGIGAALTGQDVAWAFQPYVAFVAAALSLSLFTLLGPVMASRRARALTAFVAAQPALLFAYAQWTGVKEVAAAALVALCCAIPFRPARGDRGLGLAVAAAALLSVLSVGGAAWLAALGLVVCVRAVRVRAARRLAVLAAATAALAIPALATGVGFLRSGSATLTSGDELGNLTGPLELVQAVGIWPTTDFRVRPEHHSQALVLVALVVLLGVAGIVFALRRRACEPLAYVATSLVGAAAIVAFGSPWVDAKALATASPAALLAAGAGIAWLLAAGRVVAAGVAATLLTAGVLWSNLLAYQGTWLAPYRQLVELERIGERFAEQGPALTTEYLPVGVRHFLRRLDPEGASELRRRPVLRRDGTYVPRGSGVDLDDLRLDAVLAYRTLVLRRSPVASRPPAGYRLVWEGDWYEVWQRPEAGATVAEHLPLGSELDPTAVPTCADVGRLAAGGRLAVAGAARPIVAATADDGALTADLPVSGRWAVWLGGSTRTGVDLVVDGELRGGVPAHVNTAANYLELARVRLPRGRHVFSIRSRAPAGRPGRRAAALPLGPLVLVPVVRRAPLAEPRPDEVGSLCARRLDWVERLH